MFDGLQATIRAQTTEEQRRQAFYGLPVLILSLLISSAVGLALLEGFNGWVGFALSAGGFVLAFEGAGRVLGEIVDWHLGDPDE